jgi:hypothetical protein
VSALEELASKRNEKLKRSNHVILVKNLPFSSSEEELAAMFQRHGSLDKVILPPTRVFALVCYHIYPHLCYLTVQLYAVGLGAFIAHYVELLTFLFCC